MLQSDMDVRGIGAGPQAPDPGGAVRGAEGPERLAALPSGAGQSANDTFVSLLQELSETEMKSLLNMIERPESPQQAGRLDDLLRTAVAAAAEGNGNRAIVLLAEFSALSPQRAGTLESLPSLASIRGPVEHLLNRLTAVSSGDAEGLLAQAQKLMETAGAGELVVREIKAENLILVAGRLLEAGGYANSVWSAELSRLVIATVIAPVPLPPEFEEPSIGDVEPAAEGGIVATARLVSARLQLESRLRELWLRAPLLLLLLAWFTVGLAGGVVSAGVRTYWPRVWPTFLVAAGFKLWALGFLVLVAFGFYARVRNVRF